MTINEIRWGCGLESSGSGLVSVAACCEHDSELSGSIQEAELLDCEMLASQGLCSRS
jgi:hypothetical protein